jgi:hypothetical protein
VTRTPWMFGAALAALCTPLAAAADPLTPTSRWSANTDGFAPVPPMGWNSWNAFNSDVDEEKVLASAQALVDTKLSLRQYRRWLVAQAPPARRPDADPHQPFPVGGNRCGHELPPTHRPAPRHGAEGRNIFGHRPQQLRPDLHPRFQEPARRHRRRARGRAVRPCRPGHRALLQGLELRLHQGRRMRRTRASGRRAAREVGPLPRADAARRHAVARRIGRRRHPAAVRRGPHRAPQTRGRPPLCLFALSVGRRRRARLGQGRRQQLAHQRRHPAGLGTDADQPRHRHASRSGRWSIRR